jgi:hypothetical protein
MVNLPRPSPCVSGQATDMHQRRAVAVDLVVHLDVFDMNFWHDGSSLVFGWAAMTCTALK